MRATRLRICASTTATRTPSRPRSTWVVAAADGHRTSPKTGSPSPLSRTSSRSTKRNLPPSKAASPRRPPTRRAQRRKCPLGFLGGVRLPSRGRDASGALSREVARARGGGCADGGSAARCRSPSDSRRGRGDDGERENGLGDGAGGGSAPRPDSGVDGGREGGSAQLAARVSELFGGAFLAVGRVGRLAAGSAAARRSGAVARGGAASGAPQLGGG